MEFGFSMHIDENDMNDMNDMMRSPSLQNPQSPLSIDQLQHEHMDILHEISETERLQNKAQKEIKVVRQILRYELLDLIKHEPDHIRKVLSWYFHGTFMFLSCSMPFYFSALNVRETKTDR